VKPQPKREAGQPVLDEEAFQQLLSAAFVMQEHNSRQKKGAVAKPEAPVKPATTPHPSSPIQQSATPSVVSASSAKIKTEHSCSECGRMLADDEFFCGNCGNPRARDGAGGALQKSWASLWEMHHAEDSSETEVAEATAKPWSAKTGSAEPGDEIELFPTELEEIVAQFSPEAKDELKQHKTASEPESKETALVTPSSQDITAADETQEPVSVAPWVSAAKTRAWFDSLKAQQPSRDWLAEQWRVHRGVVYIAFAALVLLIVIFQWMARPSSGTELSPFEEMLVSLGLAEAPPAITQVASGNPNTKVWVDLQTALYYCPGAELYGKTPKGRYSTQLEAQRDQFSPSTRKACD
jgi:hypothetical protein